MSDAPAVATHLDAHQAASAAAGGGKSKLMDRLRRRHLDALTGFQDKARQMSTAVDDAMADRLRDLRTELTMSRADADRRLDQTQAAIEEHRALIAASADASAARQWGDEAVLLVDEVHPAEEPFPVTLEKRQSRLEAARRRVLELGLALKHDHDSRMGAITAAEDFAKEAEAGRRAQLAQLLEALLEELSSIAYVGTTVSQLLVHRAALSTNQQLLDNDVSTKELFTKLRQHDILKQRGFAMRVADLYKAQVTVLGESVALWSRQVLTTPHFREPEARAETLVRVGRALKQTKNDVANLISGVGILVQTLLRNPHGIGSTVASEIPGGAVPSGWLQHFDHEQTALAVFKTGPEAIAEQWRVSVNVILQQLRHENGRIVEDAQASQRLLQQEAASVHAIMLHDIEQLYVPSAAEMDVVAGCAHDTGDLEHAFPLHNVQPMPDEATTVQSPAAELTSAEMHAIAAEGQWFSEALVLQLFRRGASLVATLTGSTGGLVPIIADATSALHEVATSIAYLVRKQFAEHRDEFADFRDSLYRLEQAYQLTEDHLAHAGTVEQTQELCVQAMAQLKAIEKLYGAHHSSRSGKLPRFHEALQSAVDGSKKRLLEELCAEPLSDIKAKNAQLEAELAGLKERLATPATKKGEKAVKPADAQAQLAAAQEKHSKEYVDVSALAVAVVKEPEGGGAVEFAARVPAAVKYGAADVLAKPVTKAPPKDAAPPMSAKELKAQRAKEKKAASNKKEAAAAAAAAAKAGDQSLDGTMNGAGGAADEEMPVLEAPGEHEAFYFGVLRERLTPLFHDECLVSHDAVPSVINQLRAGVLQWIHDYAHRVFACASGFITETKARIDAETNECIRRHYRRAPVLQSQVFDVRVRELEDASQSRSKHTEWLHQRLAACMTHAMSAIHGTTEPVAHDIMAIEDARDALPRLTSIPTVDANQRGVTATAKKARGHVSGRLDDVASHSEHTIQVILRDADTFAAERLRSFEEGGDVSASEKEEGLEALRNLRATAEGTAADIKSSVQNARETQESKIDAALESYKTAYDHTTEELRFFSGLGDIIAAAKAKFSQQVAAGNAASNALEAAGAQLEALVGQSTTTARRDLATQRALAALQWDTLAGAAATPTSFAACTVPVDDAWSNADVALSDRLRRTHVESEAALQTSRAVDILRNVDELRKLAYSRGLYLGCLAYGCEFSPVSESNFFDPPKEPEAAADAAGGAKAAGGSAAKGAGAGGKGGGKNAPPTSSTPDALEASARNWSAFTAVPRWDVQFTRALQPVRERAAAALDYFQKRPGALLRREPWGADKDAVKATLDERFAALEARLAELISDGIKAYRLLVQRVHLLSHRVAHEVLVCVVNHGMHSLDARSGDAVAVLEAFARSMGTARVRASGLLKGSMAAPSSRNRLQAVATAEEQRQAKSKALFMVTAGILNRDAQDEGMRAAVRASQALSTVFTLLRSLVTPEHVVPGEQVVVGQHKGLKRLMRQRMREDAARALDEKGGVKPAADAKGGAKGGGKPEPKKAGGKDDAKGGKGGKGGKGAQDAKDEDDVQQLGALERPSHDYAGIRANAVLCYDEWRRAHPGVTLRDHYSAPATWAAAEAAAQAEAAAAAAPAAGKKGAAPAKAATGKGAAGDKKGAEAPGATAATVPEAEPIVTPTLTAPHERLFQSAWLSRQQLVEVAHGVCTALVSAAEAKTIELTKGEDAWAASWADAVAALLNGTESAAPATPTNAAPTRAALGAAKK